VMIRVTGYVMMYAPIGVFGLIAFTVAKHGLAVLLPLFSLILTSFIATVVLVFAILIPMVMFLGKTGPAKFLKGIFEPWLVAFTSCASCQPQGCPQARRHEVDRFLLDPARQHRQHERHGRLHGRLRDLCG